VRTFSLRTRLTLWYTGALGATLVAFTTVVARLQREALRDAYDERLESAAGVLEFAVRDMRRDLGTEETAARLLHELRFIEVSVAIGVASATPRSPALFAGSDPLLARTMAPGPCRNRPLTHASLAGRPYRLLVRCVPADASNPALTVVVGGSEAELMARQRHLGFVLGLLLLVGIGLTTLGGHWLSGKALAPIRRMAGQVRRIGSENLDVRLPVSAAEGEIAVLSSTVNELFDRLRATLARERQFLTNAAHALRTPDEHFLLTGRATYAIPLGRSTSWAVRASVAYRRTDGLVLESILRTTAPFSGKDMRWGADSRLAGPSWERQGEHLGAHLCDSTAWV